MALQDEGEKWDHVIQNKSVWWNIGFGEIWRYRDLLFMFVHRDFVAEYKQTILGPLWFLIQPLFTTLIFTFVFGKLANISTDGVPQPLFYLAGITAWNYFAECLNKTAVVFRTNQHIFGKVYFPRLVTPLSIIISSLLKFAIQFILFVLIVLYFYINNSDIYFTKAVFLFPLIVLIMAGLGLGFGLLITSWTTKYRDLRFLLTFGIQLLMYATPVIYPISTIPEKYKYIILANPMSGIVEAFRYSFLGAGSFSWGILFYDFIFMLLVLTIGIIVFNRTERTFMDTV